MSRNNRPQRNTVNIWPGFVDALTAVLLVFIFMIVFFAATQLSLSDSITINNPNTEQMLQQVSILEQELQSVLDNSQSQLRDKQQQIAELEAEAQHQATLFQTNFVKQEANIDRLTLENRTLRVRKNELEQQLATLTISHQQTIATQQIELQQLSQNNTILQAQRDNLQNQMTELQNQMNQQSELRQTTQTIWQTELEKLSAENAELRAQQRDLTQQISTLQLQNQQQAALQQATLSTRQADLALLTQDNERLLTRQYELEQQLIALVLQNEQQNLARQTSLTTQITELDQLKQENSTLKLKLSRLQTELTESQTTVLGERERSQYLQGDYNQLVNRNAELEQQLSATKSSLLQTESRLDSQITRNQALQQELENSRKNYNEVIVRGSRSEFFSRLKKVLAARPEIRVVGDRFLLQSEVLFDSGASTLDDSGKQKINNIAQALLQISAELPNDIDWVMQVNGHTDRRPVVTSRYRSNWELSTDRALAIVHQLIDQGVSANRLAVGGYAHFNPIDPNNTAEAYQRNRRIELKLTSR